MTRTIVKLLGAHKRRIFRHISALFSLEVFFDIDPRDIIENFGVG